MAPSPRAARSAAVVAAACVFAAGTALAEMPKLLARAGAAEPTAFDVYFPPQQQDALEALVLDQVDPHSPHYHKWLTPAQFQARFGASEATVAAATAELRAAGFTVEGRAALSLHASGSVGAIERAFGVHLSHAVFADGTPELVADHPLSLLASLQAAGAHIAQYTTVAPARRHSQVLGPVSKNFKSPVGPYYAAELRQAYDYPALPSDFTLGVSGVGVTVGILMNGGYNAVDMASYFTAEFMPVGYWPILKNENVGGGSPFDPSNSTETHLDIQQSSGMAPGVHETLYNLPDLSEAMTLAGLVQIDQDNTVDVVNMSFGGPEAGMLPAYNGGQDLRWQAQIAHTLFLQGNSQGITFVASSGDHGAIPAEAKCPTPTTCSAAVPTLSVECPACDPNVLAVGGTNLVTTHSTESFNSAYVGENANPDPITSPKGALWGSGGGISVIFAKPAYQKLVTTPSATFRTVPDLALHMGGCPSDALGRCGATETGLGAERSADVVWIGGQSTTVIGTSASSPDIAGLMALAVAFHQSRLGLANLPIYEEAQKNGAKAFPHFGSVAGSNGKYTVKPTTKPAYSLVLGNGTVDGRQLIGATNLDPAGIPDTAGNP